MLVYDATGSINIDAATHTLVQVCAHATAVKQVLIHAHYPSFNGNSPQAFEKMARAMTAQLAASALQLHTLKCLFGNLHSFPPMPNLKHLVLEMRCSTLQDGIDPLPALQNLETLKITVEPNNVWLKLSDQFDCPVLDFTSLSRLRSLSLAGVMPEGILVCPGCSLHLRFQGTVDHPVWAILSGLRSLHAIGWRNTRHNYPLQALEYIPGTVWPWQLHRVHIFTYSWGPGALPAPLARVRVLRIESGTVAFRVPSLAGRSSPSVRGLSS